MKVEQIGDFIKTIVKGIVGLVLVGFFITIIYGIGLGLLTLGYKYVVGIILFIILSYFAGKYIEYKEWDK